MARMSKDDSTLFLSAPVNALIEGIYKENTSLREILEQGDLGLGTLNDLDGELMIVDGRAWKISGKGQVEEVSKDALTPFACVTHFKCLSQDSITEPMEYALFQAFLERLLPSPNMMMALKIEGLFEQVRTRSVPRQECYRPLVEVTKNQPTFDFANIEGTLVGFYTPPFLSSLCVPGFHLHFLAKNGRSGGHLLSCRPAKAVVSVQLLRYLRVNLPMTLDFMTLDFQRDTKKDLRIAETEPGKK